MSQPPAPPAIFADSTSARQQAADHKILHAKLPFTALTTTWTHYPNRPLDDAHVAYLRSLFQTNGLLRQEENHFLLVKAPRALINRIIHHDTIAPLWEVTRSTSSKRILDLRHWHQWHHIHSGCPLEVIAGQHRIEALTKHVQETGAGEEELWWTCVLYDKETLPWELDTQLRINRKESILPDCNGQIWMQLTATYRDNPDMFNERIHNKGDTERYITHMLQLGGESHALVNRMITLWRKDSWRNLLTRWSATRVGYTTFNIGTFHWMAALRLDTFFQQPIQAALDTAARLPDDLLQQIHANDWQLLADRRIGQSWRDFFYPTDERHGRGRAGRHTPRRHAKLLSHVNDSIYREMLQCFERTEAADQNIIQFPDIRKLMKMAPSQGEALAGVMMHVVEWLNPIPTVIVNRQRSNKPQLMQDLFPAVERYLRSRCDTTEGYTNQMVTDGCTVLQKRVLEVAQRHMAWLTSKEGKATVRTHLRDDPTYYKRRFKQHGAWNELLQTVHDLFLYNTPLQWRPQNTTQARIDADERITTTASTIMSKLEEEEWIAENHVLRTRDATEELSHIIRNALYTWAADVQHRAGEPYGHASIDSTATRHRMDGSTPGWDLKAHVDGLAYANKAGERTESAYATLPVATRRPKRRLPDTWIIDDDDDGVVPSPHAMSDSLLAPRGQEPRMPTRQPTAPATAEDDEDEEETPSISTRRNQPRPLSPWLASDGDHMDSMQDRRISMQSAEGVVGASGAQIRARVPAEQRNVVRISSGGLDRGNRHTGNESDTAGRRASTIENASVGSYTHGQPHTEYREERHEVTCDTTATVQKKNTTRTSLPDTRDGHRERSTVSSAQGQSQGQSRWRGKQGAQTVGRIVRRR